MHVKSHRRWEEITEFVPRGNSGSTFQHSSFMTNDSGSSSNTLLVRPEKKKSQFQFDPTKYFELPRPKHKSPVIVYSTPPDAPPPRTRVRPVVQSNHVPKINLPPTIRSEVQEVVPAVSSSILPDPHSTNTTDGDSKSIEKSVSLSPVIESENLEVSEEDRASPALAEESILSISDENVDHNPPHEYIHELAQSSQLPVALERDVMQRPSAVVVEITSESSSSTHVNHSAVEDGEEDRSAAHKQDEQKNESIYISVDDTIPTPAASQDISPTSTFNWADDAIDEEEAQSSTETFTWREEMMQYTRSTTPRGDPPTKTGPRIAEIITPAHGYFTGGRSALVLTTIGIGADIFTSWDTTITRTATKRKLPVIVEEPVSGRKDSFPGHEIRFEHRSTAAEVKEIISNSEKDKVQEIALDGGVNSAEPITTEPVVGADQLPETVVSDIPGVTENDAVLDHVVMGEKRSGNYDVSKTTILYHEAPSELPLFFLFLLVSLALFQVMP
ncbi:uncharacterized protein H6S33_011050 [Morchella sextelata]|uniref:uncharacterized protein n=1 Tax=Morchella sextelata TaxID=1174677 RepID=UPI001D057ECD|nr:uncharacterized protein H6S33_011050 [Morchella sextelata]KAH0611785.1 hypothetical protein H6S33_011050 [Morchella sextelata]